MQCRGRGGAGGAGAVGPVCWEVPSAGTLLHRGAQVGKRGSGLGAGVPASVPSPHTSTPLTTHTRHSFHRDFFQRVGNTSKMASLIGWIMVLGITSRQTVYKALAFSHTSSPLVISWKWKHAGEQEGWQQHAPGGAVLLRADGAASLGRGCGAARGGHPSRGFGSDCPLGSTIGGVMGRRKAASPLPQHGPRINSFHSHLTLKSHL